MKMIQIKTKRKKEKDLNQGKYIALAVCTFLVMIFLSSQSTVTQGASDTDPITLQLTVNEALALDCGTDPVNLGSLDPGTPVSNSTACQVTTNDEDGYDLQVRREDGDTTMDHTNDASINITDKTAWDPTASAGDGNAAAYSGTGLGFGVYSSTATKNTTWWGTGTSCHDANNLYAGFPTTFANIMEHTSYESGATITSVCYRVDTSAAQASGLYDGVITYQAIGNP